MWKIEGVTCELSIFHRIPPDANIITVKNEDEEFFDGSVAHGHYNKRSAVTIAQTIVEVVPAYHKNGEMHQI
ncbi:hypothetical protein KP509_30G030900 [Ceratopteris richardii]|uniref:Uncharacterized protein n=1 Tax=Ceratopteris richardii TaxID=49495 RepID=A0A8T2R2Y1_CERRI|nr:hypothetical protein KP509_30G030900 [Ceratopteris richardii]